MRWHLNSTTRYFISIPIHFGAIYFALYTGILIISTMFLNGPEYLIDKIKEMKNKGITQREVAEKLNISESKVSRILKRART
jgi:DNA-binding MarR family transcriptional regulator